jgi:hypothetical protein
MAVHGQPAWATDQTLILQVVPEFLNDQAGGNGEGAVVRYLLIGIVLQLVSLVYTCHALYDKLLISHRLHIMGLVLPMSMKQIWRHIDLPSSTLYSNVCFKCLRSAGRGTRVYILSLHLNSGMRVMCPSQMESSMRSQSQSSECAWQKLAKC